MLTPSPLGKEQITVVIPTLNEAKAIGKVVTELKETGYDNIIVVDGSSSDGTVEIATATGARVIQQANKGKTDAINSAFNYVDTKYMVVMDGDMSYDPKDIDNMLKIAPFYDEVIAARKTGQENMPLINRFGNKVITKIFNLLMDARMSDVLSGLYMIKLESINGVRFESKGFGIEVEVASHIASTSRKIIEINGNYRARIGNNKLRKVSGFSILRDVIRFAWSSNPAFFIFGISSLFIIPAIVILTWVAVNLLVMGIDHYVWAIIGVMSGGVGVISFLLAIMALFIKRVEYRLISRSYD